MLTEVLEAFYTLIIEVAWCRSNLPHNRNYYRSTLLKEKKRKTQLRFSPLFSLHNHLKIN